MSTFLIIALLELISFPAPKTPGCLWRVAPLTHHGRHGGKTARRVSVGWPVHTAPIPEGLLLGVGRGLGSCLFFITQEETIPCRLAAIAVSRSPFRCPLPVSWTPGISDIPLRLLKSSFSFSVSESFALIHRYRQNPSISAKPTRKSHTQSRFEPHTNLHHGSRKRRNGGLQSLDALELVHNRRLLPLQLLADPQPRHDGRLLHRRRPPRRRPRGPAHDGQEVRRPLPVPDAPPRHRPPLRRRPRRLESELRAPRLRATEDRLARVAAAAGTPLDYSCYHVWRRVYCHVAGHVL